MMYVRKIHLALACALALVAGAAYASDAPLEAQLGYMATQTAADYASVDVGAVSATAMHVAPSANVDERMCGLTMKPHQGYFAKSSGYLPLHTLAAVGVLHATHAGSDSRV